MLDGTPKSTAGLPPRQIGSIRVRLTVGWKLIRDATLREYGPPARNAPGVPSDFRLRSIIARYSLAQRCIIEHIVFPDQTALFNSAHGNARIDTREIYALHNFNMVPSINISLNIVKEREIYISPHRAPIFPRIIIDSNNNSIGRDRRNGDANTSASLFNGETGRSSALAIDRRARALFEEMFNHRWSTARFGVLDVRTVRPFKERRQQVGAHRPFFRDGDIPRIFSAASDRRDYPARSADINRIRVTSRRASSPECSRGSLALARGSCRRNSRPARYAASPRPEYEYSRLGGGGGASSANGK